MSTQHNQSFFERYLDPSDRLDELLFGLIGAQHYFGSWRLAVQVSCLAAPVL
jgi:hypothetical protein